MRERYFYLRREKTVKDEKTGKIVSNGLHRCGVIYLVLSEDGEIARGVSLCKGSEDHFTRDSGFLREADGTYKPFVGGVRLAKKRAMRAFNSKSSSEPITAVSAFDKVSNFGIKHKSEYMPDLTSFEWKVLEDRKEA